MPIKKPRSATKPKFGPGGKLMNVTSRSLNYKDQRKPAGSKKPPIRRKKRKPLSRSKPKFGPGGRLQHVTSRKLNYKDQKVRVHPRGGSDSKRVRASKKLERDVRRWLIMSTKDIGIEELLKKAGSKKSSPAKKAPKQYSLLNPPPFGYTAKKSEGKLRKKASKEQPKKSPPRKRRPSVHKRNKAMIALPKPRRGSVHRRKPALMRIPKVL